MYFDMDNFNGLDEVLESIERRERVLAHVLLVAIAVIGLLTKGMIVLEATPDFNHYVHQIGVVLETGRTSLSQPPVAYYLLAGIGMLTTPDNAVKVFMMLTSTLAIIPAYLFGHRFSGSRLGGVVCAAVATMNPYLYLMCKYSILRNILGNTFVYALLYAVGRWHGDWTNKRRAVTAIVIWVIFATHMVAFYAAMMYCLFYVARQKSKEWLPVYAIVLAVFPVLLISGLEGSAWLPHVLSANLPLQFNFPRFFEAFSTLTVGLSVLAGVLVSWYHSSPVGLWLLNFHFLSWIVRQGVGQRFLFMAYLPLSAILPALVMQDRDSKLWLFLSASLVLQYLSRFMPGGWP